MTCEGKIGLDSLAVRKTARCLTASVAIVLALWLAPRSDAQQKGQQTFRSAEDAVAALVTAAQQDGSGGMLDVLGPAGKEVISSDDPAEDKEERAGFVAKYQQMHRLRKAADGTMTLYVGAENWPFPVPLVNKGGSWYFDTDRGKEEILLRLVGDNELSAIDACHQLVDAQKEYYLKASDGHHHSQRFVSDKGERNGLYSSEDAGKSQGMIDPLIAQAGQETIKAPGSSGDPVPFKGYYFRILTRQGKHASGGPKTYLVDGQMVSGFAFLAYPAKYRSSGVMTFIVNQEGIVYQKDLGPKTVQLAKDMKEYDPNATWHRTE